MIVGSIRAIAVAVAVFAYVLVPGAPAIAKGDPHSDYSEGTGKCRSCHFNHVQAKSRTLLRTATITDSCRVCHDGTGSNYDVEDGLAFGKRSAAGVLPVGAQDAVSRHTMEVKSKAPGGSGAVMEMNCAACHAPHGSANFRFLKPTIQGKPVSAAAEVSRPSSSAAESVVWTRGNIEFCSTCHTSVYPEGELGHYFMTANLEREPGARLICEDCHGAHGSAKNAANLSDSLVGEKRRSDLIPSSGYTVYFSAEADMWDTSRPVRVYAGRRQLRTGFHVDYTGGYVEFDSPRHESETISADFSYAGLASGNSDQSRRKACLVCHDAAGSQTLYGRKPVSMNPDTEGHNTGVLRSCGDCHQDAHNPGPGDSDCYECHSAFDPVSGKNGVATDILSLMGESKTGLTAKYSYHHTVSDGRTPGENDCLVCHAPHPHDQTTSGRESSSTHTWDGIGETRRRTDADFDPAAGKGICLSCHGARSGTVAGKQEIDSQDYGRSDHSYVAGNLDAVYGSSAGRDGSYYQASCVKCHQPHGSDIRAMIQPVVKDSGPLGDGQGHTVKTDSAGQVTDSLCYVCHEDASPSLPTSAYSVFNYPFGRWTDTSSYYYPMETTSLVYGESRWSGKRVFAASAHGQPTGAMRWPGSNTSQGAPYGNGVTLSYTPQVQVGQEGKCRNCHGQHGTPYNDMLLQAYGGNSSGDAVAAGSAAGSAGGPAGGAVNNACFVCHDEDGPAPNVYQYYMTASLDQTPGHGLLTTAGGKPAGYTLLCSDCHNAHGSRNGNGYLLSDSLNTSSYVLGKPGDNASRDAVCISCHGSPGGNYGDEAPGRIMYGRQIATTPADHATKSGLCLHCHGPVHAPSSGKFQSDGCYSCHPNNGNGGGGGAPTLSLSPEPEPPTSSVTPEPTVGASSVGGPAPLEPGVELRSIQGAGADGVLVGQPRVECAAGCHSVRSNKTKRIRTR